MTRIESIYENERIVKTLLNVIELGIKLLKETKVPIERIIGRVAGFIRVMGRSEESDELRFLYICLNIIPSMFVSTVEGLEDMKKGKSESEIKEIDEKISKMREKSKEIFINVLECLKDALTAKENKKARIIGCIEKAFISLDKEAESIYEEV